MISTPSAPSMLGRLLGRTSHSGRIALEIPPGTYLYAGVYSPWIVKGIKKLIVQGYGATLKVGTKPANVFLGGAATSMGAGNSARLASVAAGSTTVRLLNHEQASLFSVGNYAVIAGLDMMGYGYPINPYFFQFIKISEVDKAKGVIRFEEPLKDDYRASWPHYSSGSPYAPDQGGPATLYVVDPSWDAEVEYKGLTIRQPSQIYATGRKVVFTDVKFPDGCPVPTQNKIWIANNITMAASPTRSCSVIEADKLVEDVQFIGGTVTSIAFQSSSIERLRVQGTVFTGGIIGTPKKSIISDAEIGLLAIGTPFFGASSDIECSNSIIKSVARQPYGATERIDRIADFRIGRDGELSFGDGHKAQRWAIPGARLFWSGAGSNVGPTFTVKDIREENGRSVVRTTLRDDSATPPRGAHGELAIRVHPAWRLSFNNCKGSPEAEDWSRAPQGLPMYSYSKRSYTGDESEEVVNGPPVSIWGRLKSLKLTVDKPYSGPGVMAMQLYIQSVEGSKLATHSFKVDLRTPGERVVAPSEITGAQPGDSLHMLPADAWLMVSRAYVPKRGANAGPDTNPSVSVEFVTDQDPR